jgi:hypothetical protein
MRLNLILNCYEFMGIIQAYNMIHKFIHCSLCKRPPFYLESSFLSISALFKWSMVVQEYFASVEVCWLRLKPQTISWGSMKISLLKQ